MATKNKKSRWKTILSQREINALLQVDETDGQKTNPYLHSSGHLSESWQKYMGCIEGSNIEKQRIIVVSIRNISDSVYTREN